MTQTMSEAIQPAETETEVRQSPGQLLQEARIRIGLTIDEVASKMRLSTQIIESLENNHYEDITAPIFVKGYLRSYARIVHLDEESIISNYATSYMDGDPPITSTRNTSPEIGSDDSRVRWVTWLIVIIMLGLIVVWWWNRYQQPPGMDETVAETQDIGNPVLPLGQALQPTDSNQLLLPQQPSTTEPPAQQTEATGNELLQAETTASTEENSAMQSQLEADAIEIDNEVITETATAISQTEEFVETPSEIPEPISNQQNYPGLEIEVTEDTWASIRDASGSRLVYDLLKSGRTMRIEGQLPINAFFGNAKGVILSYNGNKIDLSDRIRLDNTARIIIEQ